MSTVSASVYLYTSKGAEGTKVLGGGLGSSWAGVHFAVCCDVIACVFVYLGTYTWMGIGCDGMG